MIEIIKIEYIDKIKQYIMTLNEVETSTLSLIRKKTIIEVYQYMATNQIILKDNDTIIFDPMVVIEYLQLKSL